VGGKRRSGIGIGGLVAVLAAACLTACGGGGGGDAQVGLVAGIYEMFRTTDGGATWAELPGSFTLFVDPLYGLARGSTAQILVAVGGGGIYRSTDAGATRTAGPTVPFGQPGGVDFAGQTTFVAGSGGLLARHD